MDEKAAAWTASMAALWRGTAMEALGITLEVVDDERIVLAMEITDAARQPFGLLHGGISLLLAESAASCHACWGVDLGEVLPVGVEINGSHLRSATEGRLRAIGTVLSRSRRFIVHEVRIILEEEEEPQLLCTARVTNYYRRVRAM